MFRNRFILSFFILVLSSVLRAQDMDHDFEKITRHLDTASSMAIHAKVNVYARKGGAKVFSMTTSIQKQKDISLTVLGEKEYYTNGKYYVEIDHEEKTVSVIKAGKQNMSEYNPDSNINIETLKKLLYSEANARSKKTVKLISSSNGTKVYSIENLPSLKEVRISLNMHTLSIVSLSYEYTDNSEYKGQYIFIDYTRFEHNAQVEANLKTSQFFTIRNGNISLNPRFKGYKLYTL